MPLLGDVSQAAPKVIFDADTASPTINNNRAFYDGTISYRISSDGVISNG